MSTTESSTALERANPRTKPGFAASVRAADAMRTRIVSSTVPGPKERLPATRSIRRGLPGFRAAGATLVAAAALTAFQIVGGSGRVGVESASAAVRQAAAQTASSAEFSGTATVVIVHNGELWAGKTVRWNEGNVEIVDNSPMRSSGGSLLVVDGVLYAHEDGWVVLGPEESIDPDSATTPTEHLEATQRDVGGATLRRITDGMSDLTTRQLEDGSTVYEGVAPAGLVAPESGFKEGEHIRVFPFGYVAHDEASDPKAPVDVSITVGADGVISELAVAWGSGGSTWTYTVTYSGFGTTEPIVAPANAEPFPRRTPAAVPPSGSGD